MPIQYIPNPALELQAMASRDVAEVVMKAAAETALIAASLAPVLTGRLRSSISAQLTGPGEAEVVADTEYAIFVELGTADTPSQPFLRPALDAVVGAI